MARMSHEQGSHQQKLFTCSKKLERKSPTIFVYYARMRKLHSRRRSPVHQKVRQRFYVPIVLGAIMLMIGLYDSGAHQMPLWEVLAWLLGGAFIGSLFGKLTRVRWDRRKQLIIFEEGQGILMILYIVIRIISELFIHRTVGSGTFFIDSILLFTSGSLIGLSVGIGRNVREKIG